MTPVQHPVEHRVDTLDALVADVRVGLARVEERLKVQDRILYGVVGALITSTIAEVFTFIHR